MHHDEARVQGNAKPFGDGFESRTLLRLREDDTAYQPDSREKFTGPLTLLYTFNPAGTRVEAFGALPLPLWALRILKSVRWRLHL